MKRTKRRKRSKKRGVGRLALLVLVTILVCLAWTLRDNEVLRNQAERVYRVLTTYFKEGGRSKVNALRMTESNYGTEVEEVAEKHDLPASYLKALIVLECSGKKPVKPRYEKHIFNKLKKVRDQKGRSFESIDQSLIGDASDEALENLARSWGPFQLMGYKCLHLEVNVNDIRGADALDWGAKWIQMEYGYLLKQKRYADAFHYHNTGRLFPGDSIPTTHDPKYVENGLKYMEYFK